MMRNGMSKVRSMPTRRTHPLTLPGGNPLYHRAAAGVDRMEAGRTLIITADCRQAVASGAFICGRPGEVRPGITPNASLIEARTP